MRNITGNILSTVIGLALGVAGLTNVATAQQPSHSPTPKKSPAAKTQSSTAEAGEEAGNYIIISSIEVGIRGLRVRGDDNKYRSDLNYNAGVRLFDSSFLARSKDGKGGLFDTLLVTSTGWGADPNGHLRMSIEKPKWYRFDGQYRRFHYFRFLNNFANPNWIFSPTTFSRPPNPVTGEHGFNTTTQLGDFDFTLLPKNEKIRFTAGYSPERYNGPFFTSYHQGGNEFILCTRLIVSTKIWDTRQRARNHISVSEPKVSFLSSAGPVCVRAIPRRRHLVRFAESDARSENSLRRRRSRANQSPRTPRHSCARRPCRRNSLRLSDSSVGSAIGDRASHWLLRKCPSSLGYRRC